MVDNLLWIRPNWLTAEQLHPVVEEYYRRHPALRGQETVTWCLDEIQVVPGWKRFVRRLLDSENVELFVTGSSAALPSREIATTLRGRAWEVMVHPFSLENALRYGGHTLPEQPDFLDSPARSALEFVQRGEVLRGPQVAVPKGLSL